MHDVVVDCNLLPKRLIARASLLMRAKLDEMIAIRKICASKLSRRDDERAMIVHLRRVVAECASLANEPITIGSVNDFPSRLDKAHISRRKFWIHDSIVAVVGYPVPFVKFGDEGLEESPVMASNIAAWLVERDGLWIRAT